MGSIKCIFTISLPVVPRFPSAQDMGYFIQCPTIGKVHTDWQSILNYTKYVTIIITISCYMWLIFLDSYWMLIAPLTGHWHSLDSPGYVKRKIKRCWFPVRYFCWVWRCLDYNSVEEQVLRHTTCPLQCVVTVLFYSSCGVCIPTLVWNLFFLAIEVTNKHAPQFKLNIMDEFQCTIESR